MNADHSSKAGPSLSGGKRHIAPGRLKCIAAMLAIFAPLSNAFGDASTSWPQIFGQAGSYEVQSTDEITEMAGLGMRLVIKPEYKTRGEMAKVMHQQGVKYIDVTPWNMLFWTKPALCSSAENRCTQDPQAENLAVDSVAQHVNALANRPDVVGFWILDDYPGSDIHGTLEKIHAVIQQANAQAHLSRPTICGIGVSIYADQPHHPGRAAFENEYPLTVKALSNFSPRACDMIGVYAYFYAHQRDFPPADADWTMQTMLAGLFDELKTRGWTPESIPIIGIPQAFYNTPKPTDREWSVVPRAVDVATQTASFCKAGAIAITAFSWDDGNGVRSEPFDTPALKQGLVDGITQCRAIWHKTS